jgi:phosphatidylserine/phosphatidylglycerophosphate/cardiolipin synthase-like enzyme
MAQGSEAFRVALHSVFLRPLYDDTIPFMNANVDVKLGHKIGEFFLPQLQNARQRLWIMSPWVSAEYMELAVGRKNAGVDVRVITSNDYVNGQKDALSKLIESQTRITKPENIMLEYIGAGLVLTGLALIKVTDYMSLFVSLIGIALFLFGREGSEVYWVSNLGDGNLTVLSHHPYNMVHAKVYVADDVVMIGSANLTGNGLKHNTEVMALIESPELAAKMIDTMLNIREVSGLSVIPYDTVGGDISYEEPRRGHYRKSRHW